MQHEHSLPRAKAVIYWNDEPTGNAQDDVLVLSIDDPERDQKSARFENSAGADEADFQDNSSAEQVFSEFFSELSAHNLSPGIFWDAVHAWGNELCKISGVKSPTLKKAVIDIIGGKGSD